MVIKGKSRSGAAALAAHLLRSDINETVAVLEITGVAAIDLLEALREMEAVAKGARTTKGFYHASISPAPGYTLTATQKIRTVETLGVALKLQHQPRVVVEHLKHGRLHLHVVWSRIDLARMAAIPDSHNYRKHEEVARALEREFGHTRVDGAHAEREGRPRPRRRPSRAETQQGERTGVTPDGMTVAVTAAWRATSTGQAFVAALAGCSFIVARGDRRDFVIVDHAGGVHSMVRRITDATAADVRARMADVDRAALPSVTEARAMQLGQPRQSVPRTSRRVMDAPAPRRYAAARRSGGQHRRISLALAGSPPPVGVATEQPIIGPGYMPYASSFAVRVAPAASAVRHAFRAAARSLCSSPRRVLPLADGGRGGGDERLPRARHGRIAHTRMVQQRRARARATAATNADTGNDLGGVLSAIATEVSAQTAATSAGIRAHFALRMSEVCRRLPAHLVEGSLAALQAELDALLTAAAESGAAEIRGRQEAVILSHPSRHAPPQRPEGEAEEMSAGRPVREGVWTSQRLAS